MSLDLLRPEAGGEDLDLLLPELEMLTQLSMDNLQNTVLELAGLVADPSHGDSTYNAYIRFMARFRQYSLRNLLLIQCQCPEASYVASYRSWEALGRQVMRGETGIAILRPLPKRTPENRSGRAQSTQLSQAKQWGIGYVFDSSQTTGNGPIPNYKPELPGNPWPLLVAACRFAESQGISVRRQPMMGNTNGVSQGGTVLLNSSRTPSVLLQTAIHETAHELLHQADKSRPVPKPQVEAEAESVAAVVLNALGYDTITNAAAYIRGHAGTPSGILNALDSIHWASRIILAGIQSNLHAAVGDTPHPES